MTAEAGTAARVPEDAASRASMHLESSAVEWSTQRDNFKSARVLLGLWGQNSLINNVCALKCICEKRVIYI